MMRKAKGTEEINRRIEQALVSKVSIESRGKPNQRIEPDASRRSSAQR
jgi:hypothetical protein